MNDDMYIRFDDTGITVSSSRTEFDKKPVRLMEMDDVNVCRGITINSFYNIRTVIFLLFLGCAPLLVLLNMAPTAAEVSAKRLADAQAKCVDGVGKVLMTSPFGIKTINCGE